MATVEQKLLTMSRNLADRLPGAEWKAVGIQLGLPKVKLDGFDVHSDLRQSDLYEKCYNMLNLWKQYYPKDFGETNLERAIEKMRDGYGTSQDPPSGVPQSASGSASNENPKVLKPTAPVSAVPQFSSGSASNENPKDLKPIKKVKVKPTSPGFKPSDENVYPLKSDPKGYALLIVNEEFQDETKNRVGATVDQDLLIPLFGQLGYTVICRPNLTKQKMEKVLNEFSIMKEHEKVDSAIIAISSHGNRNGISCTDGETYSRKDIFEKFNNKNCQFLATKPKMFFIQACRGGRRDTRVQVHEDIDDASDEDKDDFPDEDDDDVSINLFSDMIIVNSSIEDFKSTRNRKLGSWFFNVMINTMMEKACDTHLDDMLKEIGEKMGQLEKDEKKQMCEVTHKGWIRNLYFNP